VIVFFQVRSQRHMVRTMAEGRAARAQAAADAQASADGDG
jgi:hypothetical protein